MLLLLVLFDTCSQLILGVSAQEAAPDPLQGDIYQAGLRALQDELPGIAATRFEEALKPLKDDDPARSAIQLHLIEAYVRSGNIEAALPLFDLPVLAENESAAYWKARAQLSLGHYFEAAETMAGLAESKDPTLRIAATLTRSRLLASLGETKEALTLLESMDATTPPETRDEAVLLRASILLDAEKLEDSAALLTDRIPELPRLAKQHSYLRARLALESEKFDEAAPLFRQLVDAPEQLPRPLFFGALLGYADAVAALGGKDEAVAFLLAYMEMNPGTGPLDQFFARLVPWSEENDTLSKLLQDRLIVWSAPGTALGDPVLRSLNDPIAMALASDTDPNPSELGVHALYHRALFLAHKNDSDSVSEAKRLLAKLRIEYPNHPLSLTSLLETSLLHLGDKRLEDNRRAYALGALDALEFLAEPGNLKAEAAELAARIRFADGDYTEAAAAFARARENLTSDEMHFTAINQGLAQLMSGSDEGFSELLASLDDSEAMQSLELERALLLAARKDLSALPLLDSFLRNHPSNIRIPEGRLALAELSLISQPLDLSMALAQLDSIEPAMLTDKAALRHLLARLKLSELTGEWEDSIAEATNYLRTRKSPEQPAVILKLGEAFFLNGNYNEARIQFLQVTKLEGAGRHHEIARFYAAKAGLRVGTDEARQAALALLQQVSTDNGPLAVEARLQLARAYLDTAEPTLVLQGLSPILTEDADHPARIDALILAAEAHRAIGEASHLDECLKIYDQLLARKDLPYALNNRIHFLKGLTLEQLRQPGAALDSYYRVINGENLRKGETITEWKWFYDCGFSALRLLEEGQSWRSAFSVATILAETKGYRAGEAGLRAGALQKKHMIWEDE